MRRRRVSPFGDQGSDALLSFFLLLFPPAPAEDWRTDCNLAYVSFFPFPPKLLGPAATMVLPSPSLFFLSFRPPGLVRLKE